MAKKKNNKRKVFIIFLGVITLVTVGLAIKEDKRLYKTADIQKAHKISVNFSCSGEKSIKAVFVDSSEKYVQLDLSDGRKFDLPQTDYSDNYKYANGDGTVIFLNKDDAVFLQENGTETYSECIKAAN